MDVFLAAPPISRTFTLLAFVESLSVYGELLGINRVVFLPSSIFTIPPEPWRLVSPFLLTSRGIGFLFDLYFMYTYGSGLEKNSPRFALPGDFMVYLVFVCTVIMIIAYNFLGEIIFTNGFLMAMIHTWAQDNRGRPVTFYVIQMKAEMFPLALLVLSIVSAGWRGAYLGMTGIFASHLYDFLTRLWPTFGGGRNFLVTPSFVHRLFGTTTSNTQVYGGSRPGQSSTQSSSDQTSARQGSVLPSSWSTRGAGRRLGGS